jgi:hypothetical protein
MTGGLKALARFTLAVSTIAATLTLTASAASAHESRKVGPYSFVVGWGDEPAYAGEKNSVQVILNRGNTPVAEGVDLKAEVIFGQASTTIPIEPDFEVGEFGRPGDYRAFLIPTRPGSYTFHVTGTVGNQKVDERFTSGPQSFSDIESPSAVSFPVKDPTIGELAARGASEADRLRAELREARSDASSARLVAYVAGALAVVALMVGAAAAMRQRPGGSSQA